MSLRPPLLLARRIAVLALAAGAAWSAEDLRSQQPIDGDAAAGAEKAAVCAGCHGPDGNAIAPIFPTLAGQSATYLYVQLRTFKDGSRTDPMMGPLSAQLSDQDMRDLAAHYAAVDRKPATAAAPADDADRGRELYRSGDTSRGVPPCQACHGAEGQGPPLASDERRPGPPWHTFPNLAGLQAGYLVSQLQAYKSGTRAGTSNAQIMHGVAANLDEASIDALAAYLSRL